MSLLLNKEQSVDIRARFAASGAAAVVASLLTAGATRAHAGEVHAAGSPDGSSGLGLLAIAIVAGIGYRIANRGSRRLAHLSAAERVAANEALDSLELLPASRATHRANVPTPLIATRRPSTRQSSPAQRGFPDHLLVHLREQTARFG